MKNHLVLLLMLLSSVVSAAAQPSEIPLQLDPGVAAHKDIDEIYKKFNAAYKVLDPAAVAGLYTETADYLPPGDKPIKGRAAINENFTGFFDGVKGRGQTLDITFRITQREVAGTMGYDVGIYTLTTSKDGKQIGRGRGQFIVVTKKVGKQWLFQLDTYSNLPREQ